MKEIVSIVLKLVYGTHDGKEKKTKQFYSVHCGLHNAEIAHFSLSVLKAQMTGRIFDESSL